jgi:hypothetical protein
VTEDLARRMYVEQIQSQANIKKMAAGEIASLRVTSVKLGKDSDTAAVFVTAAFQDGSSAPGVIKLVKLGGNWYFMSFTGLRKPAVAGSAETVNTSTIAFGLQDNAKVIAESGVTVFDYAVCNAILEYQVKNQAIAVAIVDGKLTDIVLGAPKAGAGTTTVPATLRGAGAATVSGETLIINKTVADKDLSFLTTFRTN